MEKIKSYSNYLNEKYFITDAGYSPKITWNDGKETQLGRYGVWSTSGRKPQVVDQGDDLEKLYKKYKLSKDDVMILSK